jgi:hypothetical protein
MSHDDKGWVVFTLSSPLQMTISPSINIINFKLQEFFCVYDYKCFYNKNHILWQVGGGNLMVAKFVLFHEYTPTILLCNEGRIDLENKILNNIKGTFR